MILYIFCIFLFFIYFVYFTKNFKNTFYGHLPKPLSQSLRSSRATVLVCPTVHWCCGCFCERLCEKGAAKGFVKGCAPGFRASQILQFIFEYENNVIQKQKHTFCNLYTIQNKMNFLISKFSKQK